jgi:glycosyltransferase involved in cell wall biosynthesis
VLGASRQAIESLENGDYQNFQIVIVDDGSTDPEAQRYLEELNLYFQVNALPVAIPSLHATQPRQQQRSLISVRPPTHTTL